ncbi:MAG: carbohydrate kinase [Sediminibacterium sp.]|nr:carbohydrate kinase [Sediminibacterium sp.]
MSFEQLFEEVSRLRVLVIGDVMLDTYCWGVVERISPEAPVPIVAVKKTETRIGGAGNVAINTASLGANTSIITVLGNDDTGNTLKKLVEDAGIQTDFLIQTPDRPTTNKTRIMGRNQQMMRLDLEETKDIDAALEATLWQQIQTYFEKHIPQVCILEDYNKGVLTETLIAKIIALCNAKGVITTVDPKKKNFFTYRGVTLFKPNLKEVKEGLQIAIPSVEKGALDYVHQQLQAKLQHTISLITLSEHGVYYHDEQQSAIIPTHIRNIADVSGAGDTVIAVASVVYAVTRQMLLAAEIANIAGGLVCEEVGTAPIRSQLLLQEVKRLLSA